MQSDYFDHCCQLAGWEVEWVRELFTSVMMVPTNLRKRITRDCVNALKVVRGLRSDDQSGDEWESFMTAALATNSTHGSVDDTRELEAPTPLTYRKRK